MAHQPRIIQLHFDGIEVLRIEDGNKCKEVLLPAGTTPKSVEMRWDGEVVYKLDDAYSSDDFRVLINKLTGH